MEVGKRSHYERPFLFPTYSQSVDILTKWPGTCYIQIEKWFLTSTHVDFLRLFNVPIMSGYSRNEVQLHAHRHTPRTETGHLTVVYGTDPNGRDNPVKMCEGYAFVRSTTVTQDMITGHRQKSSCLVSHQESKKVWQVEPQVLSRESKIITHEA